MLADLSLFLIRNAAVPPINVPTIVNGSGTGVAKLAYPNCKLDKTRYSPIEGRVLAGIKNEIAPISDLEVKPANIFL